jgi:hypothetical protein
MTKKEITKSVLSNNVCVECARKLKSKINADVKYGWICVHSVKQSSFVRTVHAVAEQNAKAGRVFPPLSWSKDD